LITVYFHNLAEQPEAAEREYNAPDPFVFPIHTQTEGLEHSLNCLCIIRMRKGNVTSMKIVLRNHVAE
jgi:hypothetical protein